MVADADAVRRAYLELIALHDPAADWLAAGAIDARFAASGAATGIVVRGAADLCELHDVIDDLFGIDAFPRAAGPPGAVRTAALPVPRAAAVMGFVEALRPSLERRGPAFYTWKTAREAIALRLDGLDRLTLQASHR